MRAGVYVRVSTEEQAAGGYSLAEQREACTLRAKELGADSVRVYADEGISGATLERPGLAALRKDVRAGQIELVICRDPDRLSRRLAHQLLLTEEFEKAGVRLEFLSFDWTDTPEGRLFYAVRGAIAEYEREKIRERTTLGRLQKARQGGMPVGFDVYGYSYDPETGRVGVRADEAAVVKQIFERFAAGWGYNTIARWLNETGVPTRRGRGTWHRQVVAQIIANSAYRGTWYYRRREFGGGKRGEPAPREEWIPISVPALVPESLWLAAQEKAREARRLWTNRGRRDYLLSGIISCGDCGVPMHGIWIKFWGRYERRYTCQRHVRGGGNLGCRPRKMVLARLLEDAVWRQVKTWVGDPEVLAKEVLAAWPEAQRLREELCSVDKLLSQAERGRRNILAALANGLVDLDEKTEAALARLKNQAECLRQRRREIELALLQAAGGERRGAALRAAAARLFAVMDEWPFIDKRDLVRALVRQVVVTGRPKPGDACGDIVVTLLPQA